MSTSWKIAARFDFSTSAHAEQAVRAFVDVAQECVASGDLRLDGVSVTVRKEIHTTRTQGATAADAFAALAKRATAGQAELEDTEMGLVLRIEPKGRRRTLKAVPPLGADGPAVARITHPESIFAASWSAATGTLALSGGPTEVDPYRAEVLLWDLSSGVLTGRLPTPWNAVGVLSLRGDGRALAAGGETGLVVWELPGGGVRWKTSFPAVRHVSWSHDGLTVIGRKGRVHVAPLADGWPLGQPVETPILVPFPGLVAGGAALVAYDGLGFLLRDAGAPGGVRRQAIGSPRDGSVHCLALSPAGDEVALAGGGSISRVRLSDGVASVCPGGPALASAAVWLPEGLFVAAAYTKRLEPVPLPAPTRRKLDARTSQQVWAADLAGAIGRVDGKQLLASDKSLARSWEWPGDGSGEGVHTYEGQLVWFSGRANPHAGGGAVGQSFEAFLRDGPAVQAPDEVVHELRQLLEGAARRVAEAPTS